MREWGMRNGLGDSAPEAVVDKAACARLSSAHVHHVAILVEAELLMRAADAADLGGDPDGAKLIP